MTAFYMFRLTILAFHGENKTEIASHTKENKFVIVFPLLLLSVLSLWFFYSFNPFNGTTGWFAKAMPAPMTAVPAAYQFDFLMPENKAENPYLKNLAVAEKSAQASSSATLTQATIDPMSAANTSLAIGTPKANQLTQKIENIAESNNGGEKFENKYEEAEHHAHMPAMILSLIIAGCGILFSFMVYQFKIFNADNMEKQFKWLHTFSYRKWYFDEIYQATFIGGTTGFAKLLGLFDNKIIDGLVNLSAIVTRGFSYFVGHFDNIIVDGLVNLVANVTSFFGAMVRKVQTGRVQTYIVFVIIGLMLLIYFFI
jgi:NADH-quinone oxidoreductase subunit L